MKNFEVEVIKCFTDKEECTRRNVGDKFFCTEERYDVLNQKGAVKLVEIAKEKDDFFSEKEKENLIEETVPIKKKKKTNKK